MTDTDEVSFSSPDSMALRGYGPAPRDCRIGVPQG
jgi:hypothetical protein